MIKVSDNDKKILKRAIKNFDEYFRNEDFWNIIDELDDIYNDEAMSNDGEPTDYAYDIERVRDHLYDDNIEEYRRTH